MFEADEILELLVDAILTLVILPFLTLICMVPATVGAFLMKQKRPCVQNFGERWKYPGGQNESRALIAQV